MASLVLSGDTSGSITLAAPAVAGSTTQTLVNVSGTLAPIVSGTAVTLTNQTAPDLSTTIPSWVKRITVMLNVVSMSSNSPYGIVQIGSGSYSTSGYANNASFVGNGVGTNVVSRTDGFVICWLTTATDTISGHLVLTLLSGNSWVASGAMNNSNNRVLTSAGNITLGGVLDRIRITTTDGTTQYDAGTINILYE